MFSTLVFSFILKNNDIDTSFTLYKIFTNLRLPECMGCINIPKVVMKLEVCGGARGGLVHGADDVRTLGVLSTEETVEHICQSSSVVQVVQDDD